MTLRIPVNLRPDALIAKDIMARVIVGFVTIEPNNYFFDVIAESVRRSKAMNRLIPQEVTSVENSTHSVLKKLDRANDKNVMKAVPINVENMNPNMLEKSLRLRWGYRMLIS